MDYIVFILIIVASFLFLRLYLVKKELRKMALQMEEFEENFVLVDFVDRDLVVLAEQINKKIDLIKSVKAEELKGEKAIKTSISMISHDMRTPLTSVIGYLQLAEKNCSEVEVLNDIKTALDRAGYCNKLVNDFFELSVIDLEKYTPVMENVNICEIVCEEILANYLGFEKAGVIPVFEQSDDTVMVYADRGLLVRVMQNLISNAIKYSAGRLEFSVSEGGLAVSDGRSMTERVSLKISSSVSGDIDTSKIFDKFYREDVSGGSDGKGLGMYICKKFVENMGGDISADCDSGMLNIIIKL